MSAFSMPPLRNRLPLSLWSSVALATLIVNDKSPRRVLNIEDVARYLGTVVVAMDRAGFSASAEHDAKRYSLTFQAVQSGNRSSRGSRERPRFVMTISFAGGRVAFECHQMSGEAQTLFASDPSDAVSISSLTCAVLQGWLFAATSFAMQESTTRRASPPT